LLLLAVWRTYADQLPSFPSQRPEFSTTSGAARFVPLLMVTGFEADTSNNKSSAEIRAYCVYRDVHL
jgi:hypothetical protein